MTEVGLIPGSVKDDECFYIRDGRVMSTFKFTLVTSTQYSNNPEGKP
jgi:hypothetical protein